MSNFRRFGRRDNADANRPSISLDIPSSSVPGNRISPAAQQKQKRPRPQPLVVTPQLAAPLPLADWSAAAAVSESVSMPSRSFKPGEAAAGLDLVFSSRRRRGARRRECEDVTLSHPELHLSGMERAIGLFCLFDGHGGIDAAQFAAANIVTHLRGFDAELGSRGVTVGHLISRAMLRTHEDICAAAAAAGGSTGICGTTAACAAMERDGTLTVAHVGDSRAVVVDAHGRAVALTRDHVPTRPDELARIETLGGAVLQSRVNGVLAISRALGDRDLQPYVSAEPEIAYRNVVAAGDQFLILASDGLWNGTTPQQAADLCLRYQDDLSRATRALVEEAWVNSADDISVTLVKIKEHHARLQVGGLMDVTADCDDNDEDMKAIASANF
mmetsp:Transcript_18693/g.45963  ORF Transcript_18693/g.45963 Transcript_18693/m.45963 type:complete len:386 (+) Transcript_18693:288-1445(+)